MVKMTIRNGKKEESREGDFVFGAALSWKDPGSHMDAFVVGEIDRQLRRSAIARISSDF